MPRGLVVREVKFLVVGVLLELGDGIEGGRFGSWSRPKTALEWELLRVARNPGPGAYAVV